MCAFVRPRSSRQAPFSNNVETTLRGINGIQSMDNLRKAVRFIKENQEQEENDEKEHETFQPKRCQYPGFCFDDFYDYVIQHLEKPTTLIPCVKIEQIKENLIRDKDIITRNFQEIENICKNTMAAKEQYLMVKHANDKRIAEKYQELEPVFSYLNCWRSPTGKQIVGPGIYPVFESN